VKLWVSPVVGTDRESAIKEKGYKRWQKWSVCTIQLALKTHQMGGGGRLKPIFLQTNWLNDYSRTVSGIFILGKNTFISKKETIRI